ncbi:MAG: hypothetical protein MUF73_02205 [Rhodobacteraceae bacterium]|jgi:hypothetical protein|nr:hypothetical protein [Paracoccaceae bacterium]
MPEAVFPVAPGRSITAFELGPLQAWPFPGEVTRGVDALDYRFVNGFVAVGDLPCRVALRREVATRAAPAPEPFPTQALNLPGFDRRLDFSGFWHRPTRLVRWVRTRLRPTGPGPCPVRIATPGGVHLWVDGTPVLGFEPFTRNAPQTTETRLPLRPDGSEVVLRLEEMAERDTSFFVELTWLGADPVLSVLPGTADAADLDALMDLARSVRPGALAFDGTGPLALVFDRPAPVPVTVRAAIRQSVHLAHLPPLLSAEAVLVPGSASVDLGALDGLPDGYHPLSLTLDIGQTRVERGIAFALLRQPAPAALAADPAARRQAALAHAARHGEARPGRTLARLHLALPPDALDRVIIEDTLDGIEGRRDCSDFVMVPLLWIRGAHGAALPTDLVRRIDAAILGWRYWVDEPGNDTMWFWSENHALCFHVSEYMAGGLFPDATFGNSGLTGAAHRALARARLAKWFDAVEAHGLAEWNSAAYYPIDVIGLAALLRWAEPDLAARAAALLDALHAMLALHTMAGVPAGSMGRAYDKELRAGPLTELAPLAAMAFGTGWLNAGVAALPLLAAAGYAPPPALADWAAPPPGTALSAAYVQGYGPAARLRLWKTAHVQLSATVDGTPGGDGHQQHVVDVQAAGHPFARVWINHPGEDDPWGSQRPSYWAGNGSLPRVGMRGDTCLVLFAPGTAARLPWSHAYAPLVAFDAHLRGADWLALSSRGGFVIVKATGPIQTQTTGPGAGIEHRVAGASTGWALIVGDLPPGGLPRVAAHAAALRLMPGDGPRLRLDAPERLPLSLDWAAGLTCGDQAVPFDTLTVTPRVIRHDLTKMEVPT